MLVTGKVESNSRSRNEIRSRLENIWKNRIGIQKELIVFESLLSIQLVTRVFKEGEHKVRPYTENDVWREFRMYKEWTDKSVCPTVYGYKSKVFRRRGR